MSPAHRTSGPTGLSVFADEAALSVRDLVLMMMAVSDNAATDILICLTGLDSVNVTPSYRWRWKRDHQAVHPISQV